MGQEKLGINNPEVIKAVALFGGGIAGTGDVCGAMLGGIACISAQCGRGEINDEESPRMFKLGHMLEQAFIEITREYGGKDCSMIARVDWLDSEQVEQYYRGTDSRKNHCQRVVGETARALGEIIEGEF